MNEYTQQEQRSARHARERHGPVVDPHASITYDAETDTYHSAYGSRTESVCLAVISTVAAVSDTDLTDMEPLNSTVNPDALENVVTPTAPGATNRRDSRDVHHR